MTSTRNILERIKPQLDESMGVRVSDSRPQLSPVPNAKDVGRRALRTFGTLAIENLIPDPDQPRTEFDDQEIEHLSKSIQDKGQLHPIRVRWSDTLGKWIIISGERRFRAIKLAGLPTAECYFQEGELTKTDILEQQLIENLLRADLKPIEEATAFDELMKLNGWTGKELSEAIRVSQPKIARSLALLKLPEDLRERIDAGEISARAAYEATKLDSEEQQRAAIATSGADQSRPSVESVQKKVRMRVGAAVKKQRGVKQTFVLEDGWKITVSAAKKANYHEVEQALQQAIEEVRLRIENNVQLG